jgi:hypothetical protein
MHKCQQTRLGLRVLFITICICCRIVSLSAQAVLPTLQRPRLTVSLKKYGYVPQKSASNRIFFRDISVGKLMALDPGLKLLFISEDVLVAYSTIEIGSDWRTASRQLEAYFIRTSDGTLLAKKTWRSTIRKDESDADTESRIIALRDGRFLIDANGTLMLYGIDLSLIREKILEPFGSREMWGVQSVSDGREIFLRRETADCPDRDRCPVQYEWRDAESFLLLDSAVGDVFQGRGVRGAGDGIYIGWSSNTNSIFEPNKTPHKLCDDWRCSQAFVDAFLPRNLAVISSYFDGVGVVDLQRGLLWFDAPTIDKAHSLSFGEIETTATGNRFGVWVSAIKNSVFDSVMVRSSVLFVFDTNNPKHVFAIPEPTGGGLFSLSPSGSQLATGEAESQLHLYNVP